MWELKNADEISAEDCWDSNLVADLKEAVRCSLETDLTGDETPAEVRELAREIVDDGTRIASRLLFRDRLEPLFRYVPPSVLSGFW